MPLGGDDLHRLFWGIHAPHLMEGIHIEGQGVKLTIVIGDGGIGIAVEFGKSIHIIPCLGTVRVEDMGSVAVNLNTFHFLGVYIAGNMISLFNDKDGFSSFVHPLGKSCTEQPCAHYQIIVVHLLSPFCSISPVSL